MEWHDTILPTCDYCRQKSAERTPPGQPVIVRNNNGQPCESCRVELVEENEDAAAVFMVARRQTVTTRIGDGQMIDISVPAVESAMRMKGVKDQWECLQRVQMAFREWINRLVSDES